jgi:hypothetical protein
MKVSDLHSDANGLLMFSLMASFLPCVFFFFFFSFLSPEMLFNTKWSQRILTLCLKKTYIKSDGSNPKQNLPFPKNPEQILQYKKNKRGREIISYRQLLLTKEAVVHKNCLAYFLYVIFA